METLVALLKIYPFTPIKRLFFLKGKLFLLVFLECRRLRFEGVRGKSFVGINLHIEKICILTATKDKIILQKNIFLRFSGQSFLFLIPFLFRFGRFLPKSLLSCFEKFGRNSLRLFVFDAS